MLEPMLLKVIMGKGLFGVNTYHTSAEAAFPQNAFIPAVAVLPFRLSVTGAQVIAELIGVGAQGSFDCACKKDGTNRKRKTLSSAVWRVRFLAKEFIGGFDYGFSR
jgi:hypothetical protein